MYLKLWSIDYLNNLSIVKIRKYVIMQLASIMDIIPRKDGKIPTVKVKTTCSIFLRDISKICLLAILDK